MRCPFARLTAALAFIGGLSISAALADELRWRPETTIRDAASLAAHIDFGNGDTIARGLGVRVSLRPYCTGTVCERQNVIGYTDSFPDPPIRLPGASGLTAQIYVASERPAIGTLAALDIFLPAHGACLRRGDVRRELGQESFDGVSPGVTEPLGAGLNYIVNKKPDFRTVLEFVFAGPIGTDVCLAFVSIKDDTFGVAESAVHHGNGWSAVSDTFYNEDPPADGQPADLLGPTAFGLTLDSLRARFPTCALTAPRPVESFAPLTDMGPPAIPLLPVFDGATLATTHSIWSTIEHGNDVAPALDATLMTAYSAACHLDNPKNSKSVFWKVYQVFRVLVFDGRVLAVTKVSNAQTGYVPAGIEATRRVAVERGDASAFAALPSRAPGTAYDAPVVLGLSRSGQQIVLVRATGPAPEQGMTTTRASDISAVYIDRALWDAYCLRVQATLRGLRHGMSYTAVAAPVNLSRARSGKATDAVPAGVFLAKLRAFLSGGDLGDYEVFARNMGGKAVLLNDDVIVGKIGEGEAPAYTVGLMPGHTLLDGLSFRYQILPPDKPDSLHRLPPYHRLLAQIDIGVFNKTLDKRYCIKRRDLLTAFGEDQMTNFRQKSTFVHRFQSKRFPDDTLYASFSFGSAFPGASEPAENECVAYLSLSQYRHILH